MTGLQKVSGTIRLPLVTLTNSPAPNSRHWLKPILFGRTLDALIEIRTCAHKCLFSLCSSNNVLPLLLLPLLISISSSSSSSSTEHPRASPFPSSLASRDDADLCTRREIIHYKWTSEVRWSIYRLRFSSSAQSLASSRSSPSVSTASGNWIKLAEGIWSREGCKSEGNADRVSRKRRRRKRAAMQEILALTWGNLRRVHLVNDSHRDVCGMESKWVRRRSESWTCSASSGCPN